MMGMGREGERNVGHGEATVKDKEQSKKKHGQWRPETAAACGVEPDHSNGFVPVQLNELVPCIAPARKGSWHMAVHDAFLLVSAKYVPCKYEVVGRLHMDMGNCPTMETSARLFSSWVGPCCRSRNIGRGPPSIPSPCPKRDVDLPG